MRFWHVTITGGYEHLAELLGHARYDLVVDGEATIAIENSVAEQGIPVAIRFIAEDGDDFPPQVDLRVDTE